MGPIVIVSPQVEKWGAFTAELGNQCQMDVIEARAGAEAIGAARQRKPVAVVIDQELGDMSGIALVLQLLQINAMINIALVSDQPEEVFHEKTEGLGILMKLSPIPDLQEAVQLSKRLMGVI
jgi:DNA-binding response OmpR family regulator